MNKSEWKYLKKGYQNMNSVLEEINSKEEYDSDICDNMDDNDIITVDSNNIEDNNLNNNLSSDNENKY
ncbi:11191_t:CDS:2 [Diversispora eburnea]|uniref:11191_t:CDS:1 n=1 Tax=Diversispora eburnea TaxID=1213867 RepID=A0A9N9B798_9GLOM|nr:11191_t:CDS:2 [Diversispora eburnea]